MNFFWFASVQVGAVQAVAVRDVNPACRRCRSLAHRKEDLCEMTVELDGQKGPLGVCLGSPDIRIGPDAFGVLHSVAVQAEEA